MSKFLRGLLIVCSLAIIGVAIFILAQAPPTITKTQTLQVTILPKPDFTLAITGPDHTWAGSTFPIGVTITPINGG